MLMLIDVNIYIDDIINIKAINKSLIINIIRNYKISLKLNFLRKFLIFLLEKI